MVKENTRKEFVETLQKISDICAHNECDKCPLYLYHCESCVLVTLGSGSELSIQELFEESDRQQVINPLKDKILDLLHAAKLRKVNYEYIKKVCAKDGDTEAISLSLQELIDEGIIKTEEILTGEGVQGIYYI